MPTLWGPSWSLTLPTRLTRPHLPLPKRLAAPHLATVEVVIVF